MANDNGWDADSANRALHLWQNGDPNQQVGGINLANYLMSLGVLGGGQQQQQPRSMQDSLMGQQLGAYQNFGNQMQGAMGQIGQVNSANQQAALTGDALNAQIQQSWIPYYMQQQRLKALEPLIGALSNGSLFGGAGGRGDTTPLAGFTASDKNGPFASAKFSSADESKKNPKSFLRHRGEKNRDVTPYTPSVTSIAAGKW